ncbi:hypothetical protein AM493_15545 [Flavobacterium akiainvivens]|uniref:Secretion system C-terminal sorting domain-containing protein n=1 Tax=Flavobacterium akiainvivens TaxID=1202724 RepID=A0A0M8MCH7_9FLAO|nr:T9SS type A sorting domain-containing protein [Flavobacterium akiainvivens]KOS07295.1 hypothetical protein AM493_15545 [Flavobacterium akiainvivens]SFQ46308.1 Por secretion system C-terminal sorting domain-containing protein [Flavobacterium akiainvivens]
MKKITLFLAMALGSLSMNAQNDYIFSALNGQTYTELTGDTSINNGQTWDWDYFGEFTIPFTFTIAGQPVDRFAFDDDYFLFLEPGADPDIDEGLFAIIPTNIYLQDRTYNTGTSSSPLSYKVEGEAPNRILKIQAKNVGAENAADIGFTADQFYMNFQIWLHESDKAIEMRYGANNITNEFLEAFTNEIDDNLVAIFSLNKAYLAYGSPANPTYGEYTEENMIGDPSMYGYPANGTVYRFAPAGTTNAPVFAKNTFSLYPNPASTVVNIRANDVTEGPYAVYNMLGAVVAQGSLTGMDTAINTANLQEGVYVIKVDNQNLKFIKK